MGACNSRLERKEAVTRCKARRRYTKQLVQARRDFATCHALYLRALRCTGAALLQFANAESNSPVSHSPSPPPPVQSSPVPSPVPPPPLSPLSSKWTSNSSVSASPILPPPPPPGSSGWDFWDPFAPAPSSSRSNTDGEWEEDECINTRTVHKSSVPPPSVVSGYTKDSSESDMAMVVAPRGKKDLSEIVKELDEYFLKAAEAGNRVSGILEAPNCDFIPSNQGVTGRVFGYGKNSNSNPIGFKWGSNSYSSSNLNSKADAFTRFSNGGAKGVSHASTVEKLYAWEKKLYLEVKNYEKIKEDHEKRVETLRKQEIKGVDIIKMEKNKMEIERLESKMLVGNQAIETTTSEIISLRESELFPQLLDLLIGLTTMWRGMYECHQVQTHITQHLNLPKSDPNPKPTSNPLREAALQLELESDRWYSSFANLIKSQREYVYSLTGWLRMSMFQAYRQSHHLHEPLSEIYALCEEWQRAVDRMPDKVASEGIKTFVNMVRAIVMHQAEERKLKKRADVAFKELEKKTEEMRSAENKHGVPMVEKRARVETLKNKAEEEKSKYEQSVGATRAVIYNNLETGFPNVFQAMTGFSVVCVQALEAVYNNRNGVDRVVDLKRLLP